MQKKEQQQQLKQQLQLGFMFSELQTSADPESFQNFFCLGIVWFGQFVFHIVSTVLDKNLVHLRHQARAKRRTWQGQIMGPWIPLPSLFWHSLPSTFNLVIYNITQDVVRYVKAIDPCILEPRLCIYIQSNNLFNHTLRTASKVAGLY